MVNTRSAYKGTRAKRPLPEVSLIGLDNDDNESPPKRIKSTSNNNNNNNDKSPPISGVSDERHWHSKFLSPPVSRIQATDNNRSSPKSESDYESSPVLAPILSMDSSIHTEENNESLDDSPQQNNHYSATTNISPLANTAAYDPAENNNVSQVNHTAPYEDMYKGSLQLKRMNMASRLPLTLLSPLKGKHHEVFHDAVECNPTASRSNLKEPNLIQSGRSSFLWLGFASFVVLLSICFTTISVVFVKDQDHAIALEKANNVFRSEWEKEQFRVKAAMGELKTSREHLHVLFRTEEKRTHELSRMKQQMEELQLSEDFLAEALHKAQIHIETLPWSSSQEAWALVNELMLEKKEHYVELADLNRSMTVLEETNMKLYQKLEMAEKEKLSLTERHQNGHAQIFELTSERDSFKQILESRDELIQRLDTVLTKNAAEESSMTELHAVFIAHVEKYQVAVVQELNKLNNQLTEDLERLQLQSQQQANAAVSAISAVAAAGLANSPTKKV